MDEIWTQGKWTDISRSKVSAQDCDMRTFVSQLLRI